MTRLENLTPEIRKPAVLTTARLDTPIGPMLAGVTDRGLALLEFAEPERLSAQLLATSRWLDCVVEDGTHLLLDQIATELAEYFEGCREAFSIPIVLAGTPFEREAWGALRAIPYGETRSYAEQARSIGRAAAVRAVGRANGRNRLAIVVPCHRVIASGGRLCGYGGGLLRKQYLIDLESRHAPGAAAQAAACSS